MSSKDEILDELRRSFNDGSVSAQEILDVISSEGFESSLDIVNVADKKSDTEDNSSSSDTKLKKMNSTLKANSITRGLFLIAGIIMYIAAELMFVTWGQGVDIEVISIPSIILGILLCALTYILSKTNTINEIKSNLIESLLLVASLLVVTGGITSIFLVDAFDSENNFLPFLLPLFALSLAHFGFHKLMKHDLVFLMAILLTTFAFASLLFGLFQDVLDVHSATFFAVCTSAFLYFSTNIISNMDETTKHLAKRFDMFAIVFAFIVSYIATFLSNNSYYSYSDGEYHTDMTGSIIWSFVIICATVALYYFGVVSRRRPFLGVAAVFMILVIITTCFRVFNDEGSIAVSLMLSSIAVISIALVTTKFNNKYFPNQD